MMPEYIALGALSLITVVACYKWALASIAAALLHDELTEQVARAAALDAEAKRLAMRVLDLAQERDALALQLRREGEA